MQTIELEKVSVLAPYSTCPVCGSNLKPLPATISGGDGGTAIGDRFRYRII